MSNNRPHLSLTKMNIQNHDLPNIVNHLNNHPEIYALTLSCNKLDAAGAAYLIKNTNLTYIDVSYNEISTPEIDKLGRALANNPKTNYIKLTGNTIGFEGAEMLTGSLMLKNEPIYIEITELDISNSLLYPNKNKAILPTSNSNPWITANESKLIPSLKELSFFAAKADLAQHPETLDNIHDLKKRMGQIKFPS